MSKIVKKTKKSAPVKKTVKEKTKRKYRRSTVGHIAKPHETKIIIDSSLMDRTMIPEGAFDKLTAKEVFNELTAQSLGLGSGAIVVEQGGTAVVNHPMDKGTKIIIENNDDHHLYDSSRVVLPAVLSKSIPFDEWPEDLQREEYEIFMQNVRTYREFWDAALEWPRFDDFMDANVREAARRELNNAIEAANKKDTFLTPSYGISEETIERRKTERLLFFERQSDLKKEEEVFSDKKEEVNHPAHYGGADNPYEVIKIIEHYGLSFSEGNVLKYLLRHKKKNGLIDLKKTAWYANRLVEQAEKK